MPPETVDKILEVTGNYLEAKIMVLDPRGRRLAITPGIGKRGAHLSRVDFSQVISGQTVVRRGYNAILEVDAIFVGTPVKTKTGQIAGAVFLIAPLTVVGSLINGLWQLVALAALIGVAISLLVALYLSKSISAPIIKLKAAAVAMAEGNFQIKVGHRSDEIGELADAFNLMSDRLGQSMDALRREKVTILAHASPLLDEDLLWGIIVVFQDI